MSGVNGEVNRSSKDQQYEDVRVLELFIVEERRSVPEERSQRTNTKDYNNKLINVHDFSK